MVNEVWSCLVCQMPELYADCFGTEAQNGRQKMKRIKFHIVYTEHE